MLVASTDQCFQTMVLQIVFTTSSTSCFVSIFPEISVLLVLTKCLKISWFIFCRNSQSRFSSQGPDFRGPLLQGHQRIRSAPELRHPSEEVPQRDRSLPHNPEALVRAGQGKMFCNGTFWWVILTCFCRVHWNNLLDHVFNYKSRNLSFTSNDRNFSLIKEVFTEFFMK